MDRFIRRALCTALVAGGLAAVGASAAHAAEAAPAEIAAAEAADAAAVPGARADRTHLVDGLTAVHGVLGALARADVAGVVAGVLGEGDAANDLLPDAPAEPGLDEPGADDPAADGPGAEPAPAEPGKEPAAEVPGAGEPGTDEPGTDEPNTDEPGTGPGLGVPGVDLPGADLPGTDLPGTPDPATEEPSTDDPATEEPGTDEPVTDEPGAGIVDLPGLDGPGRPGHGGHQDTDGSPGTDRPDAGGAVHGHRPGSTTDRTGTVPGVELTSMGRHDLTSPSAPSSTSPVRRTADVPVVEVPAADEPPSAEPPSDERRDGSVDLRWGDGGPLPDRPMHGEGSLSGDLSRSFLGSTVEPSPSSTPDEEEPVPAPGDKPLLMGHMFTGQLSLISLLLGLGIAALRTRRR